MHSNDFKTVLFKQKQFAKWSGEWDKQKRFRVAQFINVKGD